MAGKRAQQHQQGAAADEQARRKLGVKGIRRYKGVRMRSWGKWVSEIRLPNTRDRLWLGSYATPEQAARAFDVAVICLRGASSSSSATNFPHDPPPYAPRGLSLPHIQQLAAAHAAAHAPCATPLSLASSYFPAAPPSNPVPIPPSSSSSAPLSSFSPSSSNSISLTPSHPFSPSSSSTSSSSLSAPSSPDASDFQFPPLSPSPSHDLFFALLDHPSSDPSPSPDPHQIDWDSLSLPDAFLLPPIPVTHDEDFYEPALWNL